MFIKFGKILNKKLQKLTQHFIKYYLQEKEQKIKIRYYVIYKFKKTNFLSYKQSSK